MAKLTVETEAQRNTRVAQEHAEERRQALLAGRQAQRKRERDAAAWAANRETRRLNEERKRQQAEAFERWRSYSEEYVNDLEQRLSAIEAQLREWAEADDEQP